MKPLRYSLGIIEVRDDIYLFFSGEGEESCYVLLTGLELTM